MMRRAALPASSRKDPLSLASRATRHALGRPAPRCGPSLSATSSPGCSFAYPPGTYKYITVYAQGIPACVDRQRFRIRVKVRGTGGLQSRFAGLVCLCVGRVPH